MHKVTPLDLLAQVAGTLGDNRRLYSAPTVQEILFQQSRISKSIGISIVRPYRLRDSVARGGWVCKMALMMALLQ